MVKTVWISNETHLEFRMLCQIKKWNSDQCLRELLDLWKEKQVI